MTMNEEKTRPIVDDLVNAWNSRDMNRFISHLDEAVVWDDPAMLYGPVKGQVAVQAFGESVLRAFPDLSYRIREPICISRSGTRCAIPWEIRATNTGYFDFLGFAPTRQAIAMQGVDIIEIQGVKVTRIDTIFNVLPALEQVLRLKPLSKSSFARTVVLRLQKCRASWLRHKSKLQK